MASGQLGRGRGSSGTGRGCCLPGGSVSTTRRARWRAGKGQRRGPARLGRIFDEDADDDDDDDDDDEDDERNEGNVEDDADGSTGNGIGDDDAKESGEEKENNGVANAAVAHRGGTER